MQCNIAYKKCRQLNIGFCLLKLIACFLVIFQHFSVHVTNEMKNICTCAVPVFMFLSFFFTYEIFSKLNYEKFKKRLFRLMIPFYFWGVISSLICLIFHSIFNVNFENIIIELFCGGDTKVNGVLWYLFDVIVISSLFYVIFKTFSKKAYMYLILILLFSLLMQYSSINYKLFINFPEGMSYSVGRIIEMFPYAALGILFAHYDLFNKIKQLNISNCIITIFGITVLIAMLLLRLSSPLKNITFDYAGISYVAFTVVIIYYFYFLKIKQNSLRNLIIHISNYNLGIYCIHMLVGKFIIDVVPKNTDELFLCGLIYIVALLISYILGKNKYLKRAVM